MGPERFFAEHGFAPTTTYDLVWNERVYPPKAILGTAYEFATGERLASGDFEGGRSGAVKDARKAWLSRSRRAAEVRLLGAGQRPARVLRAPNGPNEGERVRSPTFD